MTGRPVNALPAFVAHADWSANVPKRCVVSARLQSNGRYLLSAPRQVGDLSAFAESLAAPGRAAAPRFIGFDFPLGFPLAFAKRAKIDSFVDVFQDLGTGRWGSFFDVAAEADEIALSRPFFPARAGPKGSVSRRQLVEGLGVSDFSDLLRRCDRATADRSAACALFWTLGGQQVGKAAISGWRDLLIPARAGPRPPRLWPFEGALADLLRPGASVVAETYPAEVYRHLGIAFSPSRPGRKAGKRVQTDRAANAPVLLAAAKDLGVALARDMRALIEDGFGPSPDGEDPFDATVGLLGMLNIVRGNRSDHAPQDDEVRRIEGWILGQAPSGSPRP